MWSGCGFSVILENSMLSICVTVRRSPCAIVSPGSKSSKYMPPRGCRSAFVISPPVHVWNPPLKPAFTMNLHVCGSCARRLGIEVRRMLVRRFMIWVGAVSAAERAEGVGALARAYLYGNFAETEKRDAEVAFFPAGRSLADRAQIHRRGVRQRRRCTACNRAGARQRSVRNLFGRARPLAAPVRCGSYRLRGGRRRFCPGSDHASSASLDERLGGARRNRFAGGADRAGGQSGRGNCRLLLTHDHERFGFDGEVREALLSR